MANWTVVSDRKGDGASPSVGGSTVGEATPQTEDADRDVSSDAPDVDSWAPPAADELREAAPDGAVTADVPLSALPDATDTPATAHNGDAPAEETVVVPASTDSADAPPTPPPPPPEPAGEPTDPGPARKSPPPPPPSAADDASDDEAADSVADSLAAPGDSADPTTLIEPVVVEHPVVVDEPPVADEPTEIVATAPPRPKRRGRVLLGAAALVVGVLGLGVAAWGFDSARTSGTVVRNTSLGTTPIEGLDRQELDELFDRLDADLAAAPLTVNVGETSIDTDPGALGARLDRDAIADEALRAGRDSGPFLRPIQWLGTFGNNRVIEPRYLVDEAEATDAIATILADELTQPTEPSLTLTGGELAVDGGTEGTTVDPDELRTDLAAVLEGGAPYTIDLEPVTTSPELATEDVQAVADSANDATAEPVLIRVLDQTNQFDTPVLRSWIATAQGDGIDWTIDTDAAAADLEDAFPALGSEGQQARFNIVDGEPIIIPASETVICCDPESIASIGTELREPLPPPETAETEGEGGEEPAEVTDEEGAESEVPRRLIELEPEIVDPDTGVEELESLGIVEEVSTFTTNHGCCEPRVTNIHRIADLVSGVVIRPGEDFSINDFVGRRTTDNGFVAAPSIINGILDPSVGGGISQFATTFFNAAFFAGIDFNEYQSHSLYISRYPRGREATVSFPAPDLSVRNTTDYGILVWATYTDTSITVTFYSTQHIDVEALDLRSSPVDQCTRYTTPRVRTYPDGTVVEDEVFAVYRPGEGFDCAGNETSLPGEEPQGPTAEPSPTDDPPDSPPTDEAPPEDGGPGEDGADG